MSQWRRVLAVFAVSAITILSSATSGVFAQQQGGSGLQISPTRNELSLAPGEVKEFKVIVKNVTSGDITVKTFLNDFEADNFTGEPKLIIEQTERNASSLEGYLKGLQDFELKAGESREVKLNIDAPGNMPPGGYYGAVRFAAVPKGAVESERQVALTASVASLVLVEVTGNVTELAQVKSVKVFKGDKADDIKKASTFFTTKPNKAAIEVRNAGNTFSKPFGRISVTKSGKEVYSYELNNKDPRGNVLPNSSRTFIDDIKGISGPGRYTIVANVSHGSGGEVITQKLSFWYIPAWLLAVLAVLLLALIVGGYLLYRRQFGKHSTKAKK